MKSGRNVFLTGEAGSGKTTVVREFLKQAHDAVVVAPTGIAAINSGGQTIHSFFMLKPCLLTPDSIDPVYRNRRSVLKKVKTLVIDEISMVRSDVFAAIDFRLRQTADGKNRYLPFGGRQVVACGDFYQLPPIARDRVEVEWLSENYGGAYAFQTKLWKDAEFENVLLEDQFRQNGDGRFNSMLNLIRSGKSDESNVVAALNSECIGRKFATKPVCLCTTNFQVDEINQEEKDRLPGSPWQFQADVLGTFNQRDYPTDFELELKAGMRVMVLVNKRDQNGDFEYVNGDVGTVQGLQGSDCRNMKVVVKFDSGRTCAIGENVWVNSKYVVGVDGQTGMKTIRREEVGSFAQIPLRPAYAVTVHKSQGLTLDSVLLDTGDGCFSHGQLYTALSRCRTLSGLGFSHPIRGSDLKLDPAVVEFYHDVFGTKKPASAANPENPA